MDIVLIVFLLLALIGAFLWFFSSDSSEIGKREKSKGASNQNRKPKHPEQR